MNHSFTQALTHRLALVGVVGLFCCAMAQEPSADEILRAARSAPLGDHAVLQARLRNDNTGEKTPLRIVLDGTIVRYQFSNPEQEIQLRMSEDSAELWEKVGGKEKEIPPSRYGEKIHGTDVTYEDISLRFLYWPNAKLLGSENIRTRNCWKIEIQAPRGKSQYPAVRLWINKESGALMRMEGYGWDGRVIKRFEVTSGQKLAGEWMLKNMRVQSFDPKTHEAVGRTYLQVLDREK